MNPKADDMKQRESEKFIEGIDYYFEDGLFVLTETFLRKRGFCCENGCRHCPYQQDAKEPLQKESL